MRLACATLVRANGKIELQDIGAVGRQRRVELIKKIEELRGTRVLVYVTGDRTHVNTSISDDAVRPILNHLRKLGSVEKLDVLIYSRGGAIDVPWRLNSAFRRTASAWDALIPFRANSSATLLSMGADTIVLGRHAELGPIDPTLEIRSGGPGGAIQATLSVEDVMAFPKFAKERFDLEGEAAQVAAFNRLADRVDALTLGNMYRTHSHIRFLADKMLRSRGNGLDEKTIKKIVATLAEEVYAHGHAVGLDEAKDIGLHVESAPADLDELMWQLLGVYEEDLKLLEPLDPSVCLANTDKYTEDVVAAVIETSEGAHEFGGTIELTAQRNMPQNLQVQLNLSLQLPAGINPAQVPQPVQQQLLVQAQQALLPLANQAVTDALKAQAAMTGFQLRWLDARWREVS